MSRLALILIIISIMSQIIGFLRESILAFFFGATEISDAYIISVVTPGLVAGFIASGVTSTFIPAYAKLATRDRNSALNFTVTFLAFLIALGLLLCITCFIYADRIVNLMAVGFSSEALSLSSKMLQITSVVIVVILFNTLITCFLQANNKFLTPAFIGLPLSVCSILGIYFAAKTGTTILMPLGFLVGSLFQMLLLFSTVLRDDLLKARIKYSPEVGKVIFLSLPVMFGVLINQMSYIFDRSIASTVMEGAISIVSYATRVNSVVEAVFLSTIIAVFYTKMSFSYNEESVESYSNIVYELLFVSMIIVIPASILMASGSQNIVQLLFERGSFQEGDTVVTSELLFLYAISIPLIAIKAILFKMYYVSQITWIPIMLSIISISLNITFNYLYVPVYGLSLLPLSFLIASLTLVVMLGGFYKPFKIDFFSIIIMVSSIYVLCFLFYFSIFNNVGYTIAGYFSPNKFVQWFILALLMFVISVTFSIKLLSGYFINYYNFSIGSSVFLKSFNGYGFLWRKY